MKTPERIKKGLEGCKDKSNCEWCNLIDQCKRNADALAYIEQLESSRWELFDDLSTAYYGKVMYGLNDDGTVYSRYLCDTMSFDQAVDEFRRLISDE